MAFPQNISRRDFIKAGGAGLFVAGLQLALPLPGWARSGVVGLDRPGARDRYDLEIGNFPITIDGRRVSSTGINSTVPGPLVRLREGEDVTLNVTNGLMDSEHASIHWHGVLVPYPMDGVPGVNFNGIPPGETFQYRFRTKQAGTYWYHSHSAFQEQTGTQGPLIIEPKEPEPFAWDREYVLMLSDWAFESPESIFRHLKLMSGYYNFQRQTTGDFLADARARGLKETLADRLAWGRMRMSPTDLLDVTGAAYTYLMNGSSPAMNWTALFAPGETVRFRVINAAVMTIFDVRLPGLDLEIVQADGKNVRPVTVHELRIGVAETYDFLVRPREDKPYTIFAEALDRSGYARGTLSPAPGLEAPVPGLRPRPVRTLEDVGMGMMADGMDHGGMGNGQMNHGREHGQMEHGMGHGRMEHEKDHGGMDHGAGPPGRDPRLAGRGPEPFRPEKNNPNVDMLAHDIRYKLDQPGIGLGQDGWRVLTYQDLVSVEEQPYPPTPERELTVNLTGNMERFMFSFDGRKFSEQEGPYRFRHHERLRLFMVNHTMMEHPIHLHGMWMQLENGAEKLPFKHTVLVKPGEALSVLITPIEKGDWAFHCHLLYHMEAGMFQVVRVE